MKKTSSKGRLRPSTHEFKTHPTVASAKEFAKELHSELKKFTPDLKLSNIHEIIAHLNKTKDWNTYVATLGSRERVSLIDRYTKFLAEVFFPVWSEEARACGLVLDFDRDHRSQDTPGLRLRSSDVYGEFLIDMWLFPSSSPDPSSPDVEYKVTLLVREDLVCFHGEGKITIVFDGDESEIVHNLLMMPGIEGDGTEPSVWKGQDGGDPDEDYWWLVFSFNYLFLKYSEPLEAPMNKYESGEVPMLYSRSEARLISHKLGRIFDAFAEYKKNPTSERALEWFKMTLDTEYRIENGEELNGSVFFELYIDDDKSIVATIYPTGPVAHLSHNSGRSRTFLLGGSAIFYRNGEEDDRQRIFNLDSTGYYAGWAAIDFRDMTFLEGLTADQAIFVSKQLGVPIDTTPTAEDFYKAPVFQALKRWVSKNPEKAAAMNKYGYSELLPDWYDKARSRE